MKKGKRCSTSGSIYSVVANSESSSDSVPRGSLRTFCLATETCTHGANCAVGFRDAAVFGGVYGEVAGIGGAVCVAAVFALLQVAWS